ncbi:unnamed protein product [Umbelopsis ramanniana]
MKLASVFAASCVVLAALTQAKPAQTKGQTGPNGVKYVKGRQFDRIFQIIFENHDVWPIQADPWFGEFWKKDNHRLLGNYHAITHVSQPNYLNTIAGSDFGDNLYNAVAHHPEVANITQLTLETYYQFPWLADSDNLINFSSDIKTVVDVLEKEGISWRAYAEGYPIHQGCNFTMTDDSTSYARRHFPFVSFESITSKKERCNNIFNADQFFIDYKNGELPQYVYYVPTVKDDMHDTNTTYGSQYIQKTWSKIFEDKYFNENALNILTFDESGNFTFSDMNNQIYTAIWGSGVETKSTWDHIDWAYYNHTSLISTVEDNWTGKVGQLGTNDTYSNVIRIKKPWTN